MPKNDSGQLRVSAAGKMLFIEVPSVKAEALLKYLRSRGVSTSPPSPYSTGTDTIMIGKGILAETVQAMLDQWGR